MVLYCVTVYGQSCATGKVLWTISELHGVLGSCVEMTPVVVLGEN